MVLCQLALGDENTCELGIVRDDVSQMGVVFGPVCRYKREHSTGNRFGLSRHAPQWQWPGFVRCTHMRARVPAVLMVRWHSVAVGVSEPYLRPRAGHGVLAAMVPA